jgi:glucosamine-6-phosphate deaminase
MASSANVRMFDRLAVRSYPSRGAMGAAAAHDIAAEMRRRLAEQARVRMVFAAAPSQNEMLAALSRQPDIAWERVEALHMDEYVGLAPDAPQRFGTFLRQHLFALVTPGFVAYIDGSAPDVAAECARYAALLAAAPIDIVCAGIGENGHMAFNDPHVANFVDPAAIKLVTLDQVCRQQQVNDGAFAALDDVPTGALTLTMPSLLSAAHIYCVVPGPTKAEAVRRTCRGPIGTACPASAMRNHPHALLYLDDDATTLLDT